VYHLQTPFGVEHETLTPTSAPLRAGAEQTRPLGPRRTRLRPRQQGLGGAAVRCHRPRLRTEQPDRDDQPAVRKLDRSPRQRTPHRGGSGSAHARLPHPGSQGRKLPPEGRQTPTQTQRIRGRLPEHVLKPRAGPQPIPIPDSPGASPFNPPQAPGRHFPPNATPFSTGLNSMVGRPLIGDRVSVCCNCVPHRYGESGAAESADRESLLCFRTHFIQQRDYSGARNSSRITVASSCARASPR
jgi:hypothetical protein